MKKDDHKHARAKEILKKACYADGGKVEKPKPDTDGEPDMDPIGKKHGGKVSKADGKKAKKRADKKHR